MNQARKTIAITVAIAASLGLCAGVNAQTDANVSILDNGAGPQELSAQFGMIPTLEGTVSDVKKADIPSGKSETQIPIENSSGMLGVDVQITKGGEYIESVGVKNGSLVVKVRNSSALTEEKEYSVNVTLYDMATGASSKITVTGIIGASGSSSKPDGSSSSKPDGSSSSSGSSQPEQVERISLKNAENGVVTANLYKYGKEEHAEIPILVPEGCGTVQLREKEIVKGRDVVRKVSVVGKKLVVEAKFPYDMLEEPEDYEVQVTLGDNNTTATFTIKGSVYWQDTDAPVDPDEYREKKYVVVDFDGNDGASIHFKNGSIQTEDLRSGVANLEVSGTSRHSVDYDGLDLYFVSFPANPRLDRDITLCLDADEGNQVYEISSTGKRTKIDTTYNKSSRELRFQTRRLGEYVVTKSELDGDKDSGKGSDTGKSNASSSSKPSSASSRPSSSEQDSDNQSDSTTGGKRVPNTGRFSSASHVAYPIN